MKILCTDVKCSFTNDGGCGNLELINVFSRLQLFFLQNDINRRLDSPRHTCHPEI